MNLVYTQEEVGRQRKCKAAQLAAVEKERHNKATCVCITCCELRDAAWEHHVDPVSQADLTARLPTRSFKLRLCS
jgi:hypothetical protein